MARNLYIGLLAVIIAAGVSWTLGRRGLDAHKTAVAPSANDDEDRVAQLEREVARVKREMQWLSTKSQPTTQPSGEAVAAPTPNPVDEKARATPADPEVSAEKEKKTVAARFEQLSIAMAGQTRDSAWAESAEKELGTVVRQLRESGMKGMTVLNSECRSSICKVDVVYDDAKAQTQISDRIRSPIFSGGEVRRYEENGQQRSTAYYYRQGYDRPI